jgi:predicted transcriptional regulator
MEWPDVSQKQLIVRMPSELHQTLKSVAFFTNRSMNELAVAALAEYVAREEVSGAAFEAILDRAETDYRGMLDTLKER